MENKKREQEFEFLFGFDIEDEMGAVFDYNGSPFVLPDESSPVTSIHICPNCDGCMEIEARINDDGDTEFVSHRCMDCGYEY